MDGKYTYQAFFGSGVDDDDGFEEWYSVSLFETGDYHHLVHIRGRS